ncbi:MAG: hypothetical protein WC768_01770 [Patescibacteria group bacterium]|jgi:hypothetical protein
MIQPPGKISSQNFKQMLANGKSYLPQKISRELEKAGLKSLLTTSHINKDQALRAIKYLQAQGSVSKFKAPSELWKKGYQQQQKQDEAIMAAEKHKHIATHLRLDLDEELAAEERGEQPINYDPRSALGKNLIDEIETDSRVRQKKVKKEADKRDKFYNPKAVKPAKPQLMSSNELEEMDI